MIPLKRLVGYREISEKHLRFCSGPANSLYTSSSVAAQNILISRVLIWDLGISPLATSNHMNISVQRIKSWKIILKPPTLLAEPPSLSPAENVFSARESEGGSASRAETTTLCAIEELHGKTA